MLTHCFKLIFRNTLTVLSFDPKTPNIYDQCIKGLTQIILPTNKSPISKNLWWLCCRSLHHHNPRSKIPGTLKCKAAKMKLSSKSLEHISRGKRIPRGPLKHSVIRRRLSKHRCSLGRATRERESKSYAARPAAFPPLNLEELARFNPIFAIASSLAATLHKKCPLRTLMGKCALNWAGGLCIKL